MVWNGFGLAYMQPVSNCCENHHPDHMLQHILLSIFLYQQHLGIYIHTYIYIHLIWLKTLSSSSLSLYRHQLGDQQSTVPSSPEKSHRLKGNVFPWTAPICSNEASGFSISTKALGLGARSAAELPPAKKRRWNAKELDSEEKHIWIKLYETLWRYLYIYMIIMI